MAVSPHKFNIVVDDLVAPGTSSITQTAIVPSGRNVNIQQFNGSCDPGDYISLQWGAGATWQTIMASYGNFKFGMNETLLGDGSKRIRVVRYNNAGLLGPTRRLFCHVMAVLYN